jgi:hypothetical protein
VSSGHECWFLRWLRRALKIIGACWASPGGSGLRSPGSPAVGLISSIVPKRTSLSALIFSHGRRLSLLCFLAARSHAHGTLHQVFWPRIASRGNKENDTTLISRTNHHRRRWSSTMNSASRRQHMYRFLLHRGLQNLPGCVLKSESGTWTLLEKMPSCRRRGCRHIVAGEDDLARLSLAATAAA